VLRRTRAVGPYVVAPSKSGRERRRAASRRPFEK
jgi:hypothetical protein